MRPNNAISTIAIKSKHILNDVLERIIIIETKFVQREDVIMAYLFDSIIIVKDDYWFGTEKEAEDPEDLGTQQKTERVSQLGIGQNRKDGPTSDWSDPIGDQSVPAWDLFSIETRD